MKDITGKSLYVGDKVATSIDGYTYTLVICDIVGFTAKKVKLSYPSLHTKINRTDYCLKFPEQLCKISNIEIEE